MQKIKIENFGAIQYFEAELRDILLFMGEQASGKSAISKLIYFCKGIKDELMSFVYKSTPTELEHPINAFSIHLGKRFFECFGATKTMPAFNIQFNYTETEWVRIFWHQGYAQVEFNDQIKNLLATLFQEIQTYQAKKKIDHPTLKDYSRLEAEKRSYLQALEEDIYRVFKDKNTPIFVPAGRSLLSTLSEHVHNVALQQVDYFMRLFLQRIEQIKPLFKTRLEDLIQDKIHLTREKVNMEAIDLVLKGFQEILRGEYRIEPFGEEHIYYNHHQSIELRYASSGQQEVIWILNLIFLFVLDNEEVFAVFEEPEAHLYPEMQIKLLELLVLLANIKPHNQLIITTHSPYILKYFNNLLYASQLKNADSMAIKSLLSPICYLEPQRFAAYFIENGTVHSMTDINQTIMQIEENDKAQLSLDKIRQQLFALDNLDK